MQRLSEFVNFCASLLIRPQRAKYVEEQLVGGRGGLFRMNGKACARKDFVLPNDRGDQLQCSLYFQGRRMEDAEGKNCVVYLHGNCGCRLDANDVVRLLLPEDICVCCLDFAGSGLSGGEYITLGKREPRDLKIIVTFLRTIGLVQIGLWGRSMGAVTALRYLHIERDLTISGILVDSPFTTLVNLIHHLVSQKNVPRFATSAALYFINRKVQALAGFTINDVDTVASARECWVPALIAHGEEDTLIPCEYSRAIVASYSGDCQLMLVKGDHNDARPIKFQRRARAYFKRLLRGGLKKPEDLFGGDDPGRAGRELETS